jgi:hypothetical protein
MDGCDRDAIEHFAEHTHNRRRGSWNHSVQRLIHCCSNEEYVLIFCSWCFVHIGILWYCIRVFTSGNVQLQSVCINEIVGVPKTITWCSRLAGLLREGIETLFVVYCTAAATVGMPQWDVPLCCTPWMRLHLKRAEPLRLGVQPGWYIVHSPAECSLS